MQSLKSVLFACPAPLGLAVVAQSLAALSCLVLGSGELTLYSLPSCISGLPSIPCCHWISHCTPCPVLGRFWRLGPGFLNLFCKTRKESANFFCSLCEKAPFQCDTEPSTCRVCLMHPLCSGPRLLRSLVRADGTGAGLPPQDSSRTVCVIHPSVYTAACPGGHLPSLPLISLLLSFLEFLIFL